MIDIKKLKELALAATPQNLDTAQEKLEGFIDGYIECPCCGGEGTVKLNADYCNYDGAAMGVQFYGIGPEHVAAEAFFRAANPTTVLELIALVERLDFELMTARGSKAWAHVPEEWLEDLRGNVATPQAQPPLTGAPNYGSALSIAREALQFYADREHLHIRQDHVWDTIPGQPRNLYTDDRYTATVENGYRAKQALKEIADVQGATQPFLTDAQIEELIYPPRAFLKAEDWDPVTKQPKPRAVASAQCAAPDERAEFEVWASEKRYLLDVYETGSKHLSGYANTATAHAWEVWQVARASVAPSQAEIEPGEPYMFKLPGDHDWQVAFAPLPEGAFKIRLVGIAPAQPVAAQGAPYGWVFSVGDYDVFAKGKESPWKLEAKTFPVYTAPPPAPVAAPAVAEGWKLVPVKPTLEMIEAGATHGVRGNFDDLSNGVKELSRKLTAGSYRDMLTAAPSAPVGGA